ncbi:MAG: class I SAM-dependent RNA methyltransferase [Acetobacteraceae bacterium]
MAARRPACPPSAADPPLPVRVERIGADGDGIAALPGGKTLYLADTLPGELVQPGPLLPRSGGLAGAAYILEPSPDRVAPPCPHFGPCGGCTLQHWRDPAYAEWKAARLAAAVRMAPVAMARTPPGARRRIDLAITRDGPAIRIGLHRRRSHEVVDMHACPILRPELFAVVQALRPVLLRLAGLRREGSALVNLLEAGPDLLLRTDGELTAGDRVLLAGLARDHGMPRISWTRRGQDGAEPACQLAPATTRFDGWATEIPPGAFLQASEPGERAIVAAVLAALPAKLPAKALIIELFAGCGSLTHALSGRGRVMAYEGDPAAAAALRRAGNPRVSTVKRDLARQPLLAAELKGAAVVVLDPPYGGALAQMPALAASGLPIVYVSCNPVALARDAQTLFAAGYEATTLQGIDQFLWSSSVEGVVGFLPRGRSPARARSPIS